MDTRVTFTRRSVLGGLAGLPVLSTPLLAQTSGMPFVAVSKDTSCGCCGAWVDHLEAAGFPVSVMETPDIEAVKQRLGVPAELASCHTAEVAGYVIEGHVPASALRRLLSERPAATGLAVPGMPVGSPGMQVPGVVPESYDVVLFGPGKQTTFVRFLGAEEL